MYRAIKWTKVDLSSQVFFNIHPRAISQEALMNLIHTMCLQITLLKSLPLHPGANELKRNLVKGFKKC